LTCMCVCVGALNAASLGMISLSRGGAETPGGGGVSTAAALAGAIQPAAPMSSPPPTLHRDQFIIPQHRPLQSAAAAEVLGNVTFALYTVVFLSEKSMRGRLPLQLCHVFTSVLTYGTLQMQTTYLILLTYFLCVCVLV